MPFEKNPDEIGALWLRTSANGAEYMTGEVNGEKIVAFRVKNPTPKGPTWRILKSKPREEARPSRVDDADDDPLGF